MWAICGRSGHTAADVIAHIVLFQPRPDLSAAQRQGLADAFATALRDITSIRRVRVGRRHMHGRGYEGLMRVHYEYAALLEFDNAAGLQAYLEHPAHEQLAARFFTAFEEALMYDFELKEGEDGLLALLAT
jgi:hypothetical protein